MVILECPTKVPGRLQVVLDRLRTIWGSKTCKTWFFGWTLTENRSAGSGPDLRSLKNDENLDTFSKIIFFQTCLKTIPRDPLHTLKARKHPNACFWAWLRSLKPQKHPWMARWHSNSWIVSLNISDANGTGFSGYPTRVPGLPQVVFNRFTDSYPKPRFAAPGPAWPSYIIVF